MKNSKLDQLKEENRQLIDQLTCVNRKENEHKKILEKIRENERKTNALKFDELLSQVNKEQQRKRAAAAIVWELEEIREDITPNDGSLHKVKVKKYPKIAAQKYVYPVFRDGRVIRWKLDGNEFSMYSVKSEYNKPTEYTRPATFADFLQLNSIEPDDITKDYILNVSEQLNAANEQLKAALDRYAEVRKALKISRLQYIGLIDQISLHTYEYKVKRY